MFFCLTYRVNARITRLSRSNCFFFCGVHVLLKNIFAKYKNAFALFIKQCTAIYIKNV